MFIGVKREREGEGGKGYPYVARLTHLLQKLIFVFDTALIKSFQRVRDPVIQFLLPNQCLPYPLHRKH